MGGRGGALSRRAALGGAAAGALGLGAAAAALWWPRPGAAAPPGLTTWPAHEDVTAGAGEERAWLAAGTLPGAGTRFEPMARQALVDLHRLMQVNGSAEFPYTFIAGPDGAWRYSWPRDAAFAAVAFTRTGHHAEALWILTWLRVVQDLGLADGGGGGFEARYTTTGGTPDRRREQADGAGWAAWATAEVLTRPGSPFRSVADLDDRHRWPYPWTLGGESHVPAGAAGTATGPPTCRDGVPGCPPPTPLSALVRRTGQHLLTLTDDGRRLPEPSSDYWERRESRLTLGTAAGVLLGLRHAAAVHEHFGLPAADPLRRAASRQEGLVHAAFASSGYQRYAVSDGEGEGTGPDAATCFLLPPFTGTAETGVLAAWRTYQERAARPAGGFAPGAGWKDDGISWTPEVSLVAFTAAAAGRREVAEHWLDWLDAHRTPEGSLPEKVLADGAPAGPAPLGWSAANVLLALDHLDGAAGGAG